MDRQEFYTHRGNPRRGTTNSFFDIEKLEVQKHPLALCNQVLNHLRSGSRKKFESDLHEYNFILHPIEKPLSLIA
jgi:hypothetical protein